MENKLLGLIIRGYNNRGVKGGGATEATEEERERRGAGRGGSKKEKGQVTEI